MALQTVQMLRLEVHKLKVQLKEKETQLLEADALWADERVGVAGVGCCNIA